MGCVLLSGTNSCQRWCQALHQALRASSPLSTPFPSSEAWRLRHVRRQANAGRALNCVIDGVRDLNHSSIILDRVDELTPAQNYMTSLWITEGVSQPAGPGVERGMHKRGLLLPPP